MAKTNKVAPSSGSPAPADRDQTQKKTSKGKVPISKDFLLNQGGSQVKEHEPREKRNSSVSPAEMPEAMRKVIKDALTHSKPQAKDADIPVNKKGRPHRPLKTKEEMDKEIAQLLWKLNIIGKIQDRWADYEFKAFHTHLNLADLCTHVSLALMPILTAALLWDFFATFFLEIPNLTTLRRAGVTVPFHYIAIPTAMYGFMIQSLHKSGSKLIKLSLICLCVHPILFILRIFIEVKFGKLRNEKSVRYEHYHSAAFEKPDDFEGSQETEYREIPTWQLGNL